MSRLVQASAGVPPQVESMRPMGTCCFLLEVAGEEVGDGGEALAVSGVHCDQPVADFDVFERVVGGVLF